MLITAHSAANVANAFRWFSNLFRPFFLEAFVRFVLPCSEVLLSSFSLSRLVAAASRKP
jgi:hypothetical protein